MPVNTANTANALMEYESLFRKEKKQKMSNACFKYSAEQNEKTAIEIFKYAFEEILGWTPADVVNNLNAEVIRAMNLETPYAKLIYPRELKKERDYFYVAKICYPEKIHSFSERDIILYMYKAVLDSKNGKFPKEYFVERDGDLRAKVCLQYVLTSKEFFKNKDELYGFFAKESKASAFLKKYHLLSARSVLFESSLDYLHASLPMQQRDEFLYAYYKFRKAYKGSEAEKMEPVWKKV